MQSILEGCSNLFGETYILYCSYLKLKIESEKNLCSFIKDMYEELSKAIKIEIESINTINGKIVYINNLGNRIENNYKVMFRSSALHKIKKKIEQLIIENEK
jgi:hypothetical protein